MKTSTKTLIWLIFGLCTVAIQARTVYRSVQPYDIPVKVVYDGQIAYEKRDLKEIPVPQVDPESQLKLDAVVPAKLTVSYDEEKNVVKVQPTSESAETKTKGVSEVIPEKVQIDPVSKNSVTPNLDSQVNFIVKDPVVSEVLKDQIVIETNLATSGNPEDNQVKAKPVISEVQPIESFETHSPSEIESEKSSEKNNQIVEDPVISDTKTVPIEPTETIKDDEVSDTKTKVTEEIKVISDSTDSMKSSDEIKDSSEEATNNLRNSESHPAQIPNLKSQLIEDEFSRDANGTRPNGTFANIQQSISNVIENIRPAHVVQVVVDRFSNRNSSNSSDSSNSTVSGFQQTITNAIEMIRPVNVVQAVVDRFSNRNSTNNTKEEVQNENGTFVTNFQQSLSNVIENIRPAHVVQVVVDRFSNRNNTENQTDSSTSTNSTFANIQHAISNALEAVRPVNVVQAVVDRFSNRNNTNQKNSTSQIPPSPAELTNLQAEVNKTINNFRNTVNQAFKDISNTIRATNGTLDANGNRPILESIQANFNASMTNFVSNVDKLFNTFFNSSNSNSNSTNIWQSFIKGIQSSITAFAQTLIPNFNSNSNSSNSTNSTNSSNSTQADNPVTFIQQTISTGLQSFVDNMNQIFTPSGTQNDQSSSGPFQTIGNFVNSIFRPESQSDTETQSNFNPVQALSSGIQSLVNVFRPSSDEVAKPGVANSVVENQVVDQPENVAPQTSDSIKKVEVNPKE